jgi:hypothetical protein
MAKRKQDILSTLTPNPSPEGRGKSSEEIGYTVGLWAWKDQYQCKQCEFDTLDLDAMLEHLLKEHSVVNLKEPFPPSPDLTSSPSPLGEGGEKADGIFEIDLKEDQ